jgi:hypothetical protein
LSSFTSDWCSRAIRSSSASPLGLLVPSLAFNVALSSAALLVSCALVFQGVRSFCRIEERRIERAFAITQLVFGAGFGAWGFLILLLVV